MTLPKRDNAYLVAHADQVNLIDAELSASLETQAARFAVMDTRASVLIGASTVLGTVISVQHVDFRLKVCYLIMSAIAAGIGIYVGGVHRVAQIRPAGLAEEAMQFSTAAAARYRYAREKECLYRQRQRAFTVRVVWVTIGYIVLAASLVLALLVSLLS